MPIGTQCPTCQNYIVGGRCPAFEDDIPPDIMSGDFDHTQPHPEQVDDKILYEPVPGVESIGEEEEEEKED